MMDMTKILRKDTLNTIEICIDVIKIHKTLAEAIVSLEKLHK